MLLTDAATDDSLRAIHIRGAGTDFCAGADWVATNSAANGPAPATSSGAFPTRRPSGHRTGPHHPSAGRLQRAGLGRRTGLQSRPGRRLHRRHRRRRVLGAVSWTAASSPDSGSTWLLPRLVGLARAKSMLLLGEKVSGTDAADWGLIHRCVDDGELDDAAEQTC